MSTNTRLVVLWVTSLLISGCATDGPIHNNSNLPKSKMATPLGVVDGSAIAFHAETNFCKSVTLSTEPELPDGAYGDHFPIMFAPDRKKTPNYDPVEKRKYVKTFTDNFKDFYGDGSTLNVIEMPPGKYAIGGVVCSDPSSSYGNWTTYSTPPGQKVIYGIFNVRAGRTIYIGNINVDVDPSKTKPTEKQFVFGGQVTGQGDFTFGIQDKSKKAKSDFGKAFPMELNNFIVEFMETPIE